MLCFSICLSLIYSLEKSVSVESSYIASNQTSHMINQWIYIVLKTGNFTIAWLCYWCY